MCFLVERERLCVVSMLVIYSTGRHHLGSSRLAYARKHRREMILFMLCLLLYCAFAIQAQRSLGLRRIRCSIWLAGCLIHLNGPCARNPQHFNFALRKIDRGHSGRKNSPRGALWPLDTRPDFAFGEWCNAVHCLAVQRHLTSGSQSHTILGCYGQHMRPLAESGDTTGGSVRSDIVQRYNANRIEHASTHASRQMRVV